MSLALRRALEDVETWKDLCMFSNQMSAYIDHADKVSGQKRIQIQRSWKGKGPSILTEHKSTSQRHCMVHRIKLEVDELAGYIMMTFDMGGLLVSDLNEDSILWSLPQVCKQFLHCHLIVINNLTY